MTWEQLFLLVLGVATSMGAFMFKDLAKKVQDTGQKLHDFQAEVPKIYVTKADLEKDIDRILHRFDKLEVKLDRLIDRDKE